MFKINNKDTRSTPLAGWGKLFNDITTYFSNSANSLIRNFLSMKFLVFDFLALIFMQTVGFNVTAGAKMGGKN